MFGRAFLGLAAQYFVTRPHRVALSFKYANQSLIAAVSRLRLERCTIIASNSLPENRGEPRRCIFTFDVDTKTASRLWIDVAAQKKWNSGPNIASRSIRATLHNLNVS